MSVAEMRELVQPLDDSALALHGLTLAAGEATTITDGSRDSLLYVHAGAGRLQQTAASHPPFASELTAGTAALVLAGERSLVSAGNGGLQAILATVGDAVDRHAPMGLRETTVALDGADAQQATGARSFQILFGPHNGSTRATFFAGHIPPGKAPWHYHLYDEIVWVPDGPGRLHAGDVVANLGRGAAFRLRPRQVHIVENVSADRDLTIIGVFTPAGSPSAAYLMPDVAAEYRVTY